MNPAFQGVVLITNAGNELGQALVTAFIDAECRKIVLTDASLDAIGEIKNNVQDHSKASNENVADIRLVQHSSDRADDFERMIDTAKEIFGTINYCVNCRGMNLAATTKPTAEMEAAEFKAGLAGTSRALWLCCRAELRILLSQADTKGSIVNIVPYGNLGTHPGHAVLAAAGYGSVGMSKSMARDHVHSNVRINVVAPVATKGDVPESRDDESVDNELLRHMKIPGRLIELNEIASAAVFLAGEAASGITGVVLPVDAGWSMVHG